MRPWLVMLTLLLLSSLGNTENSPGSFAHLQNQLLAKNPELRASRAKVASQEAMNQAQNSAFLPQLSVHGGYGKENTLADVHEGYLGYLSANWNIFRGGKDWQAKQISEHDTNLARLDLEATKRKLIRELGESYYEALLNAHFISLDTEKIQFLKNQRAMAQKKIDAGLTSSIDALELDLEESTLNAEIETHKTDLQNALNTMQALLAQSEAITIGNQETFPRHSIADFPEMDFKNNLQIQKQQLLEASASLMKSQEQTDFLPSIDVTADYGQIVPHFDNPSQSTESKVSILLSWTFFSGMNSYNKVRAATQNFESQQWQKSNVQNQSTAQAKNLQNKAHELIRLQNLLEKRQAFTQKYYDLTLSEYRRGVKNSSDLANATNSLFENKTKLFQVQKDLAVLKLKYDEITQ